jgi:hypothetical protein
MSDVGACRTRCGERSARDASATTIDPRSDLIRERATFVSMMLDATRVPTQSAEYSLGNPGSLIFARRAGFFRVDCVGSARLAYARLQRRTATGDRHLDHQSNG